MSKRENQQINQNCIPRSSLINYIEGKLSDREMNAIERHLSDCPMCSDEMEGLKILGNPREIEKIEQELNRTIDRKSNSTKSILHLTPLKIAASLALLIGISSIIYFTSTLNTQSEQMALSLAEKEAEISDAIDALEEPISLEDTSISYENKPEFEPKKAQNTATTIASGKSSMQEKENSPTSTSASASKKAARPISPPRASTQNQGIVSIVNDDVELFDTEFDEHVAVSIIQFSEEEDVAEEEVFFLVEEMPTFAVKGYNDFREYIAKNINYPALASQSGIEGRVYVKFIVEPDGSLSGVEVVRSVDPILDQEAIRVVKESPKWIPGMQRGKPVRVSFTFPVYFRLN